LLQAAPEQRMNRGRFAEEQQKNDSIHMLVVVLSGFDILYMVRYCQLDIAV